MQRGALCQGLGGTGQVGGVDVVARTVPQIARQGDSLGNHLPAFGTTLQLLLGGSAGDQQGQFVQRILAGFVLRGLVFLQGVETQKRALHEGLGDLRRGGRQGGWQNRQRGGAQLACRGRGCGAGLAQVLQFACRLLLPQAHQKDAWRRDLATRAQQRGAVQGALEIAALDIVANQSFKARVELGSSPPRAQFRILPQRHRQHVCRNRLGFVSLDFNKHFDPSL